MPLPLPMAARFLSSLRQSYPKEALQKAKQLISTFLPLYPRLLPAFWEVCKAGLPFADSSQADHIYPLVWGYFHVSILPIVTISN